MLRIKTQTKRKIAGFVAFLLAAAMILSSVSVLFTEAKELTEEVRISESI